MNSIALILTSLVVGLLVAGAVEDVRTARIPNALVIAGLCVAPVAALASGGLSALGDSVGAALLAFVIGFAGFAIGAIGGGDAKFLMVGAAIVGLPGLVPFLLAAAAIGGVLGLAVVVWSRQGIEATVMTLDLAKSAATLGRKGHRGRVGQQGRIAVPYGVAIAGGALVCLFTPFAGWLVR